MRSTEYRTHCAPTRNPNPEIRNGNEVTSYNDILLGCARGELWRPLRNSAFRKYCRRNRNRSFIVETTSSCKINTVIGDSVDNQIFVYGVLEPGTTHVVSRLGAECDCFVDVGCNIGYFSCLFGSQTTQKRLIAIDPNPKMIERTKENLELNGIRNHLLLNVGIGAQQGRLCLNISRRRHSLSSFAYVPDDGNSDSIEVEVCTLSEVIARHNLRNALVKIDTEGFEYQVFRGLSTEAAANIKFIIFELAMSNLQSAGISASELLSLPVMQIFDAYRIGDHAGAWIVPQSLDRLSVDDQTQCNLLLARKGSGLVTL